MTIPHRFVGGALDLGQVKAQAEARAKAAEMENVHQGEPGQDRVSTFFAVSDENFESDVVRRSAQVPVIVLIGSARSPQSEQLKTDLKELASLGDYAFVVAYVDADSHGHIAHAFGARSVPTVIVLAAGQPITNFEGGQPREALEKWTAAVVAQVGPQLPGLPQEAIEGASGDDAERMTEPTGQADPRLDAAVQALNAGDFDAAAHVYEDLLADDPTNADIRSARNTALLLKRVGGLEDPVGAAVNDKSISAQLNAADAEIIAGQPEQAFSRIISAVRLADAHEKEELKGRLFELFSLFESTDPRVLAARTHLASALY